MSRQFPKQCPPWPHVATPQNLILEPGSPIVFWNVTALILQAIILDLNVVLYPDEVGAETFCRCSCSKPPSSFPSPGAGRIPIKASRVVALAGITKAAYGNAGFHETPDSGARPSSSRTLLRTRR